MHDLLPDPQDILPADRRSHGALTRFTLRSLTSARDPAFETGYRALNGVFGSRNELEPRGVLAEGLEANDGPPVQAFDGADYGVRYHFIVAYDETGALAGVRDCSIAWRWDRPICVVHLSHVLVMPPWRRSGLAGLLRAAPLTLARRALNASGLDAARYELFLCGEMEPADLSNPETVGRLVAYGKAGFMVIPPQCLPYCQPDFRHVGRAVPVDDVVPLPMLPVVLSPARSGATRYPVELGDAFVRYLYVIFSTYVPWEQLESPFAHALEALGRETKGGEVPLLPLPSRVDDRETLAPLLEEAVLPFHMPSLVKRLRSAKGE